ncbi:hypothetical protein CRUP_012244 [Coryphaenoides rupestris]|nr:hypothetical protein CRUP_012244 [Coryphaenoides rupestris]
MKDSVESIELGEDGKKRPRTPSPSRPMACLRNKFIRVGLAETLCTYVMMVVTGHGAFGQYFSINLGFGLGVTMGVHVGGTVSGAHMNAAVSLALCVFGRLDWKMLPVYVVAQLLGSFLAAATIFTATAGIFATYPAPYLSLHSGFIDQVFGTAMLLLCLTALSDQRNKAAPRGCEGVMAGLLVLLIGVSLGSNSGYAINPTRDLAPRFFTAIAGWGSEVFRAGNGWWWVPLVAPLVGGVLGVGLYKALVELHHPALACDQNGHREQEEMVPLEKHQLQ